MKPFLVDTPVALIFFARPDVLKETFTAIKKARPSKLFLIQDGARENRQDDVKNIKLCLDIVSDIDWNCQVFKNYSDVNLGCGMRIYTGLNWAFKYVDRLMIIEDDCKSSPGFFIFCNEILERYKNDDRMDMISGMNNLGVYEDVPSDYFFSQVGAIWGWATWKRAWDNVNFDLKVLEDPYALRLLTDVHGRYITKIGLRLKAAQDKGNKLSSWSFQRGLNMFFNNGMIIVPKKNLVSNIGITENSANSPGEMKLIPRGLRRLYNMKTYDVSLPLKHPTYIINDVRFKKKQDRIMGVSHPVINTMRLMESIFYRIIYGDFKSLLKGLKRRLFSG